MEVINYFVTPAYEMFRRKSQFRDFLLRVKYVKRSQQELKCENCQ